MIMHELEKQSTEIYILLCLDLDSFASAVIMTLQFQHSY